MRGSSFWILYFFIVIPVLILVFSGIWKMFRKAGKPGWAVLVPVYNMYCLFDIAWGNGWIFLLLCVPIVNIAVNIIMNVKLAAAFGRGKAFGIGLFLLPPVFMAILGWGPDSYLVVRSLNPCAESA